MSAKKKQVAVVVVLCAALGLAGFGVASIGCKASDSAIEVKLCTDTINAMCAKIKQCFPNAAVFSAALQMCTGDMGVFCASDELYGCDIDNAKLRSCKEGIEAMACNMAAISTFPAECTAMVSYTS